MRVEAGHRRHPDNFVLATGEMHSGREFWGRPLHKLTGGSNGAEQATKNRADQMGRVLVEVNPRYFRPTEVEILKARRKLGWQHTTSFDALVREMVETDVAAVGLEQERRNRYE